MNIKILDCTLRDGGYINNWDFTNSEICRILDALNKSQIDIIECGYLNDKKGKNDNSTLYKNTKVLDNLIRQNNTESQKVVMINLGDYDISKLLLKSNTLIDGIRLAFHKKDLELALEESKKIISLGYKLYLQPMVTKNYSDIEFLSLISRTNKLGAYSFYIVDSFGSMSLKEFQRYLILADSNLNKNILLGYHSHNNMQLAFSNAINMSNYRLKRDIILDASIYGIGRGAGNLNSELITDYLNNNFDKQYNTSPLLEIIDELLYSYMENNSWGFSPAQYLSAYYDCHPNYANYLINKNTNHIVGVKKVLERLPLLAKVSFDKHVVEKLYIDTLLEKKTGLQSELKISNKKIMLIASGSSLKEYYESIKSKLGTDEYIAIALNHKPQFKCDYYFFSNQKRYDEFKNLLDEDKIVITSNIATDKIVEIVLDIEPLVYVNNVFNRNISIIILNYLIKRGIQSVEIAGLDGYSLKEDNYNYDEKSIITDKKVILEENKNLSNALVELEKNISIEFITPSIYKQNLKLKILGIIPARYNSSRFEGKPLCLINNIPMIKRTYNQVKQSSLLDDLIVATDSTKIKDFCESENIPVIMTSETCLTGTDRIAEVAEKLHYDLYVNIQGDEPVIDSQSIDEVVNEFKIHQDKYIAYNLYKKIDNKDEISSNTIIKVITNENDELMYMSRLPVPFNKSVNMPTFKKQVCVYGFTKKALKLFSTRNKTVNEQYEDIEILRFLDMGYRVKMKETTLDSIAVDIPEDVKKVEEYLNTNGYD